MQLTFPCTLRGKLASAQKNMKLSPSWLPVVGAWLAVRCGTGRAGLLMARLETAWRSRRWQHAKCRRNAGSHDTERDRQVERFIDLCSEYASAFLSTAIFLTIFLVRIRLRLSYGT